jgi:hypothetical protein
MDYGKKMSELLREWLDHEDGFVSERGRALHAYWSADNHASEHVAYQRLIRLGIVDDTLCDECAAKYVAAIRDVARDFS